MAAFGVGLGRINSNAQRIFLITLFRLDCSALNKRSQSVTGSKLTCGYSWCSQRGKAVLRMCSQHTYLLRN